VVTGTLTAPAVPLSAVRNDRPQPYIQVLRDGRIVHLSVPLGRLGQRLGEPMLVIEDLAGAPAGTQLLSVRAGLIREGTAVTQQAAAPSTVPAPAAAATN
jgi:membrane fusion protein, multidrug efflux system